MIKSMTGFGRCEIAENSRKITVEMKSVNHRYLDVNLKMPKSLNFFESAIRSELKNYITRGKVDVFISYEDLSEHTSTCLLYTSSAGSNYDVRGGARDDKFHYQNIVSYHSKALPDNTKQGGAGNPPCD